MMQRTIPSEGWKREMIVPCTLYHGWTKYRCKLRSHTGSPTLSKYLAPDRKIGIIQQVLNNSRNVSQCNRKILFWFVSPTTLKHSEIRFQECEPAGQCLNLVRFSVHTCTRHTQWRQKFWNFVLDYKNQQCLFDASNTQTPRRTP